MADGVIGSQVIGDDAALMAHTSEIVSAYLQNHAVEAGDLPALIKDVHTCLRNLSGRIDITAHLQPAVPVNQSVTDEFLICLEDGKQFKSLKRHLRTKYDMTPEEYREKWGLPFDYPMVAPAYARQRSKLAKQMGLGQGKH